MRLAVGVDEAIREGVLTTDKVDEALSRAMRENAPPGVLTALLMTRERCVELGPVRRRWRWRRLAFVLAGLLAGVVVGLIIPWLIGSP